MRGLEQRLHAREIGGKRVDRLAGAPEQRLLRLVVLGLFPEEPAEPHVAHQFEAGHEDVHQFGDGFGAVAVKRVFRSRICPGGRKAVRSGPGRVELGRDLIEIAR